MAAPNENHFKPLLALEVVEAHIAEILF